MAVRLRLARVGKKNAPIFRIVAIDSRKMRDGLRLDNLGTYNPTTDEYIQFHVERFEEWLKKGALPTDSVEKLYKRFKKRPVLATPMQVVEPAPVVQQESAPVAPVAAPEAQAAPSQVTEPAEPAAPKE